MIETLSPRKFLDQVEKINEEARRATEDLLDQQGDKKYVAIEDWADECDGNMVTEQTCLYSVLD